MKTLHTCVSCGKEYEACDWCDANRASAQRWRTICCSAACYQAYVIYTEYRAGRMAREDAEDALRRVGVTKIGRLEVAGEDRQGGAPRAKARRRKAAAQAGE